MKAVKYLLVLIVIIIGALIGYRAIQNQDVMGAVEPSKTTVSPKSAPAVPTVPAEIKAAETKPRMAAPEHKNGNVGELLAALSKVNWSKDQIAIIQREFDGAVRLREQAELRVAMREVIEPGKILITIPAFPDEGNAILDRFYATIGAKLGPQVANNVAESIGNQIKLLNHDFGAQEQNILFETTKENVGVVHGGSRTIKVGSAEIDISGASIGSLNPAHLGSYEYLKPLFFQNGMIRRDR